MVKTSDFVELKENFFQHGVLEGVATGSRTDFVIKFNEQFESPPVVLITLSLESVEDGASAHLVNKTLTVDGVSGRISRVGAMKNVIYKLSWLAIGF